MSQTAKKLTQKRILAIKAETTAGTAETLSASDASWWVNDPKIEDTVVYNELQSNGTLSPPQGASGSRMGKLSYWIPAHGGGSTAIPTWASVMLPACCYAQSGTTGTFIPVAPNGSNATTVTAGFYEDGVLRSIAGGQGSWKFVGEPGKIARFEFEITGKIIDPTDTALLTPTYPASVQPLVFQGVTNTVGGFSPSISKTTIDANQKVYLIEDATDTVSGGTGFSTCIVTQRNPMATLDPEMRSVATRDWFAKLKANTIEAYALTISGGANNTIAFSGPKAQTSKKGRVDSSGVMREDVEMRFTSSSAAGNDELTISFS